jgi:hypothetical protein
MKLMTIITWIVVFCLVSPLAMAVYFDDGLVHDIDYELDPVYVDYGAPGMGTTVNLLEGGVVGGNMEGFENCTINISGGSIPYGYLEAYGYTQVHLSAGFISDHLRARGYETVTQVTVSGGSIGSGGLWGSDNSQVHLSGGSIDSIIWAYENSQFRISGGSIGTKVIAEHQAVITIYGSDFAINGVPFGYGELRSVLGGNHGSEPIRRLTGMLYSGEPIDNDFYIGQNASIILTPIPEPSLAILLVGLLFKLKLKQNLFKNRTP